MKNSLQGHALLVSISVSVLLCFFALSEVHAQEMHVRPQTPSEAGFTAPKRKSKKLHQKLEKEPPVTTHGILSQAFQTKEPWQFLSPLAPEDYGDGNENISQDPEQLGKPQGMIVFGIQW